MKVHEVVEQLLQEDPNAELVVLPASWRCRTRGSLKYDGNYFNVVSEVAGKDTTARPLVAVVLLTVMDKE